MPRKGENIYKRRDGRWEGRYIKNRSPDGKAKYGYVYAKSYREIRQKLISQKALCNNSEKDNELPAQPLCHQLAAEWLTIMKPQIKESSYIKYRNLIQSYITPRYGDRNISDITADELQRFATELLSCGGAKGAGLSAKTVTDTISVMRSLMKHALRKGIHLQCTGKEIIVKQAPPKLKVLSPSEQTKLTEYICSNLSERNLGIMICLFAGLRIGEICALKWEDISFSNKTLFVHQTMQRIQNEGKEKPKTKVIISPPKSICSVRTIPLTDELLTIMKNPSVFHEHGYILTGCDDKFTEPRTMENHFKKVLTESDIAAANFHTLRHTFATRCIEVGFDVKSLSEILGHASVTITMNRYVHPSMSLKRENMNKLSGLFAVK